MLQIHFYKKLQVICIYINLYTLIIVFTLYIIKWVSQIKFLINFRYKEAKKCLGVILGSTRDINKIIENDLNHCICISTSTCMYGKCQNDCMICMVYLIHFKASQYGRTIIFLASTSTLLLIHYVNCWFI